LDLLPGLSQALRGQRVFVVEALDFHLVSLPDEDRQTIRAVFYASLAEHVGRIQVLPANEAPPADAFVVQPRCTLVERGNYNTIVNLDSELRITVRVVDSAGRILDEVGFCDEEPATYERASSGARLRELARRLGANLGRYLNAHG
jgi:hypothetical protein